MASRTVTLLVALAATPTSALAATPTHFQPTAFWDSQHGQLGSQHGQVGQPTLAAAAAPPRCVCAVSYTHLTLPTICSV
eukprot:5868416-Prymnesium_polylepis.1